MKTFAKGFFSGIAISVISGLLVWTISFMISTNLSKIDIRKVVAYLPYANDYVGKNGQTYKGAAPAPPSQMARDIDPKDPIPLNLAREDQKLTIGVRNLNVKTIEDVRIFIEIPNNITIMKYDPWTKYSDSTYYISLGNINSGVGHNAIQPVFFKVKQKGKINIDYVITGRNFEPIRRLITFDAY